MIQLEWYRPLQHVCVLCSLDDWPEGWSMSFSSVPDSPGEAAEGVAWDFLEGLDLFSPAWVTLVVSGLHRSTTPSGCW